MKSKVVGKEAILTCFNDGIHVMVGGFMACGTSETLMDMIIKSDAKNLVMYCNDGGFPDRGIGRVIGNGQCAELFTSHIGLNPEAQRLMNEGKMIINLVPQGTLAEQVRAGGSGLGGVLTPTGLGTEVANGKQVLNIDGKDFLLEKALKGDVSIIQAYQADHFGNCKLIGTTRNFNTLMALAGQTVIVAAEEIVTFIDPNEVNIPGVLVDFVIKEGE
ncbi:MAG: CoA transferase subunit A [Bacilli bacterium]|jgi:acetate CoA/acetoacetate CoA-transferase alpha subunit|nr:CoA transferase subunit A [Bacilli bacterium]